MKKEISKSLCLYFNNNFPKVYFKSKKKYTVTLGIGGNIGDVKKRFNMLILMLKKDNRIKLIKTSPLLKNPPFGFLEQDDFINAIIVLKTDLSPNNILKLCWIYENRFKRKRSFKDAPRTLDIDVIFIKEKGVDIKINTKKLIVPHAFYKKRQSVLIPLKYI